MWNFEPDLYLENESPSLWKRSLSLTGGWGGLSLLSAALVVLYLLSRDNYLLFHSLVELFAVVVACVTFMIAWHARRYLDNGFFIILGSASLGVAIIDLLHALAYKNMGVFPMADANLPTQLWIAARWLQVVALFAAPFFLDRKARPGVTLVASLGITALLLASIFWWRLFPVCFVEGEGLTTFKIASEYLFILLLSLTIVLLRRRTDSFSPSVLQLLCACCAAFILAELSFTLYTDVFGISNMAGHLFKVVGCYCLYRAVVETGLSRPFDLLFRELKQGEMVLRRRSLELESVNRDLDAFNYSVSHDLRRPLSAISMRAEVLLEMFADKLTPEVRRFIEGIQCDTGRMNDLITTLLEFARLGSVEPKSESVDLSAQAGLLSRQLQESDPQRRVSIDIAAGCTAEADPELTMVLLENLIGNAWKYTGRVEAAEIGFGSIDCDGERVFFVRDNGVGFPMEQADALFEPFRRLHADWEWSGFGIGLATVRRIVVRHGGRVWAESVPGEGSKFYFTL